MQFVVAVWKWLTLPFDEEHEFSVSFCGADDAFRFQGAREGSRRILVSRFLEVIMSLLAVHLLGGQHNTAVRGIDSVPVPPCI